MVSRPAYLGGLGFGLKWDMGWMHDTLDYMAHDPVHRRWHHGELTFRMIYAFNENFVLPLSHDEVVHGKGSLLARMPGDEWQQFANLRLLFGYMWAMPGKKLLFMGGEFGQGREWSHEESLDWHLLEYPNHRGVHRWVQDLNAFYRATPALWQHDFSPDGFEWIDANDHENSVLAFIRKGRIAVDQLLCTSEGHSRARSSSRVTSSPWCSSSRARTSKDFPGSLIRVPRFRSSPERRSASYSPNRMTPDLTSELSTGRPNEGA